LVSFLRVVITEIEDRAIVIGIFIDDHPGTESAIVGIISRIAVSMFHLFMLSNCRARVPSQSAPTHRARKKVIRTHAFQKVISPDASLEQFMCS
jgi:hypothetical protein